MTNSHEEQIRIVQETVAGKEITFAHVMGSPAPIIYQKLGLNPQVDYRSSAIGIMNMTPPGIRRNRLRYRRKKRKYLSGICRPFYWHTDHYRRHL